MVMKKKVKLRPWSKETRIWLRLNFVCVVYFSFWMTLDMSFPCLILSFPIQIIFVALGSCSLPSLTSESVCVYVYLP